MLLPRQSVPVDRFVSVRDRTRWVSNSLFPQDCPQAGSICQREIANFGMGCGFQCLTGGSGFWGPGQVPQPGCDYHDSRCPGSQLAQLMAH